MPLCAGLLAAGCSTTPQRNFTGQPYPTSFATVITATSAKSSKVTFSEVNGRRASDGWRDAPTVVDVRPGNNTFKLIARSVDDKGSYSESVSFDAQEGQMYRITLDSMPDDPSRKKLTTDALQLGSALPIRIDVEGETFSDIASLLDFWGILSKTSDVSFALSSESQRRRVSQDVERRVETIPHAQAKAILSATSELIESISKELKERESALPLGFLVRDTSGNTLLAAIGAPYKEDPPPDPYVYIPPVTYTPPPKTYVPPQINFTPPPSFR
ncbi:MAG TPA: hypothetical protein PKE17_18865 [Saprospiraceae bacterium]|nr:hypothetical protein [Saprospiraceae bacterium]